MNGARVRRALHPYVTAVATGVLFVFCNHASLVMAGETDAGIADSTPAHDKSHGKNGASDRWISLGLQTGFVKPDAGFADYQWETTPRVTWGAQALVGKGRFAMGLRLLRSNNTQHVGVPRSIENATVRSTTVDLIGRGRLVSLWGNQLLATASVGRVHLGYEPDQVTIDPSGLGITVEVALKPVTEWVYGGGLAVQRRFARDWAAGIETDYRVFSMETAHRSGDGIVFGRESFGDLSARLELAWRHGW